MTSVFRKRTKSDAQTEYTCSVRFLDDTESIQLTFKKDTLGQWLFDRVCEKLNLVEKDYFGLRYVDSENQRHWLDPLKTVFKQLKGLSKMVLCFRVKFYPEDPMKLHEEITRYYLFLQLRRDLHHGRLLCPHDESIHLAACIIQSEVGDYDPQDHLPGYVSDFKMLPKQTPKHEEKIMEAHKALAGEVPAECEASFLKKAASMDTYGVDPHQVKDQRGDPLYLGVTHLGIMTFRGSRRTQLFKWGHIRRIAYEGKMFIINYNNSEDEDGSSAKKDSNSPAKHQAVGFKCVTAPAAKYLWRCAVEQQLFFTLSSSATAPKIRSGGTLFSRGSKFRFSGRCQNEAYEASENIRRSEPPFARTSSLPNFAKKSHHNDNKSNTMRPKMSESFKEDRRKYNVYLARGISKEGDGEKNGRADVGGEGENGNTVLMKAPHQKAAVDVPNILVNDATVVTPSKPKDVSPTVESGPQVSAPLAQVEAYEEKMQETTVKTVKAAPPPGIHKENGQAVRERSGVLETSIDEPLVYEPNRTFEESDDDSEEAKKKKPSLDDQIKHLEEELIKPEVQRELSLTSSPTISKKPQAPAAAKRGGRSCVGACVRTVLISTVISLILFAICFYIIFFSNIKHPYISKAREHLQFLEPVRDFIGQKSDDAVRFVGQKSNDAIRFLKSFKK